MKSIQGKKVSRKFQKVKPDLPCWQLFTEHLHCIYNYLHSIYKALDIDLEQIDCQVLFQQRWGYLGSAKNCNLGSATMVSHMQFLAREGEENSKHRGKGSWEGCSKKSPWLFIGWVLASKEEESYFLMNSAIVAGHESSPFWSLDST